MDNIREFSCHLAAKVIAFACSQNQATDKQCISKYNEGFESLKNFIKENQWKPEYRNLIY